MKLSLKLPLALAGALSIVMAAAMAGIVRLNGSLETFSTRVAAEHHNQVAVDDIAIDFKKQVQEWKDTLLRGKDPAQREKYWGNFRAQEAKVADEVRALVAAMPAGENRSLVEKFGAAHATMGANYRKGFDAFTAANFDATAGDVAVKGMDRPPTELLINAARSIGAASAKVSGEAVAAGRNAVLLSVVTMLAAGALTLMAGIAFIRTATRPVGRAADAVRKIASGDLTTAVEARGSDEIADLSRALESMREALARVISSVRRNADCVAVASKEIAHGNQDLSERTEEQASALEQTSATMTQLGATVRNNADNARQANQLAHKATQVAQEGGTVVGEVVETMKGIIDSSNRIAEIIGVIDSIAFQTNILALNAAVEAARAGEQGRGFAVVAGEVRNLAQRSADAAKEIKTLITASVERVNRGSALVDRAGVTMTEVIGSIRRASDIVGEISAAASEQAGGVAQVGEAVAQMDRTTQQNAALVEESAAAAESLKRQADELVQAVAVFTLAQPGAAPTSPADAGARRVEARQPAPRPAQAADHGALGRVPTKVAAAPSSRRGTGVAGLATADSGWTAF